MLKECVPFTQEQVRQYLDECIMMWRKLRTMGEEKAPYYIDAYQSVRVSLFGELL